MVPFDGKHLIQGVFPPHVKYCKAFTEYAWIIIVYKQSEMSNIVLLRYRWRNRRTVILLNERWKRIGIFLVDFSVNHSVLIAYISEWMTVHEFQGKAVSNSFTDYCVNSIAGARVQELCWYSVQRHDTPFNITLHLYHCSTEWQKVCVSFAQSRRTYGIFTHQCQSVQH